MVFYIVLAYLFRFQFSIHLLIVLSSGSIVARSATFSRLIMLYNLRPPSWIRVQGKLVRTTYHIVMDSQVVTVDQFASMISSIQQVKAKLVGR